MAESKIFIDGMMVKDPREGSPKFVIGSLSINVADFTKWYDEWKAANPDEAWINIDLLRGRSGKPYAALNTYKKLGMTEKPAALRTKEPTVDYPADDINPEDIPFN